MNVTNLITGKNAVVDQSQIRKVESVLPSEDLLSREIEQYQHNHNMIDVIMLTDVMDQDKLYIFMKLLHQLLIEYQYLLKNVGKYDDCVKYQLSSDELQHDYGFNSYNYLRDTEPKFPYQYMQQFIDALQQYNNDLLNGPQCNTLTHFQTIYSQYLSKLSCDQFIHLFRNKTEMKSIWDAKNFSITNIFDHLYGMWLWHFETDYDMKPEDFEPDHILVCLNDTNDRNTSIVIGHVFLIKHDEGQRVRSHQHSTII